METLIIHLDSTANKSKIREALKIFKGVTSVSDKITLSDIEPLADEALVREMKKADKTQLLSYDEGAKEFEKIPGFKLLRQYPTLGLNSSLFDF